jgi:hypothetical protein
MSKGWAGFFLLVAVFLGRVDSSLALITLFSVGAYLNKKVIRVVKSHHANSTTSVPNNPN